MTEYESDQMCKRTVCDCKCMTCPLMAKFQRSELGLEAKAKKDFYEDALRRQRGANKPKKREVKQEEKQLSLF